MTDTVPANTPRTAPYGTWESPVDAKLFAEKSVSKEDVIIDPVTSILYHLETRPSEGGRNVVVESQTGVDLFGKGWNARTRVQEYGGAPAAINDGILTFSNLNDGQVYTENLKTKTRPKPVTSNPVYRFADFAVHPRFPHLVVCILEDHTQDAPSNVLTSLVTIDTSSDSPQEPLSLVSGADFYSNPRFNEDGTVIAWCQWNHPDMPWDGCQIFISGVQVIDGRLILSPEVLPTTRLAGKPGTVSAVQPTWIDSCTLVFSCDISGYHNPWVSKLTTESTQVARLSVETRPLLLQPVSQDFTDPSWWLGGSNIAVLDDNNIIFSASKDGRHQLYVVRIDGTICEVDCPFVHIVRMRRIANRQVAFLGTTCDKPKALITCSFDAHWKPTYFTVTPHGIDDNSSAIDFSSLISLPVPISFMISRSSAGQDGSDLIPVHVLFFPPHNPAYIGPAHEKPCTIVNIHGGPTSIESQGLNMEKQFFTSRGWAWMDVNHAGSSNHGRRHIERLNGNWGITDVEDCVYAVKELSSPKYGLIDPKRVVIRGGSAGGYTTLCALCNSNPGLQVFAAGTSSYGVSDLRRLVETTHKFQSWYVQGLLGGTYEEKPEVYHARSPVFHAQNIKAPLLILQGSLDPIVPPSQSEAIVKSIREQGGDVECTIFDGESHGWREAENIEKALRQEAAFYERVFGFSTFKGEKS